MFSSDFLRAVSTTCANLAPVAGAYLDATSQVSDALLTAKSQQKQLKREARQARREYKALKGGSLESQFRRLCEEV